MPVPWLRILKTVLGVSDFARLAAGRAMGDQEEQLVPGTRALGHLETRLAGVVVAALKEAFDRDSRRLELEREQLEAERQRAERALKLELLRQAGDREVGRLRLLAGVAAGSWLGTLFFSTRLASGSLGVRIARRRVGAAARRWHYRSSRSRTSPTLSADGHARRLGAALVSSAGKLSPWLIVCGLALIGAAMLAG